MQRVWATHILKFNVHIIWNANIQMQNLKYLLKRLMMKIFLNIDEILNGIIINIAEYL